MRKNGGKLGEMADSEYSYIHYSQLLSFIISSTVKHELSSTWKYISSCNDVMNHVDCVIKRDVYPHKMHSCSKNIRGVSFFSKIIRGILKKTYVCISWVILQ